MNLDDLQRKLIAAFGCSIPRILKAGEILGTTGLSGEILRLRTGWACRFPDIIGGRKPLSMYVYLAM